MRRLTTLLVVALLCGAVAPADASPRTRLTVSVDLGVGVWEKWTLTCDPTGGTHPNRKAACTALRKLTAKAFAPVPGNVACTMIYGGPEVAKVSGSLRGSRVAARFDRTNGCEIARWQKLSTLFTVPGQFVVRGSVSLSPTCPVQQQGQDCTDPSVDAQVTFTNASGASKQVKAIAGKGFATRLPRGTWTITADAGMRCESVDVVVPGDASQGLNLSCDTGIR